VPGWKAFTPILAPLSNASPEGEGIKKKTNRAKKKNRTFPDLFFRDDSFTGSSGNSIELPILPVLYAIRMPCPETRFLLIYGCITRRIYLGFLGLLQGWEKISSKWENSDYSWAFQKTHHGPGGWWSVGRSL